MFFRIVFFALFSNSFFLTIITTKLNNDREYSVVECWKMENGENTSTRTPDLSFSKYSKDSKRIKYILLILIRYILGRIRKNSPLECCRVQLDYVGYEMQKNVLGWFALQSVSCRGTYSKGPKTPLIV